MDYEDLKSAGIGIMNIVEASPDEYLSDGENQRNHVLKEASKSKIGGVVSNFS